VGAVEQLEPEIRDQVFELLDGIDLLHRGALGELAAALGDEAVGRARAAHPAVAWLFDAYAVGVDERAAAEEALASVRPYIHSHGGDVQILDVDRGVVRVRMEGACAGCSASAVTLQEGIETALIEGLPGFASLEVEPDDAPAHPPPGPTLLQIGSRPDW
jgi:Fe-S cluster biogenesis protein NfuA